MISNSTTLSKYIWELKDNGKEFNIKWSILKHAKVYTAGSKTYSSRLGKKLCILNADKRNLFNKRSELISKCRHLNKLQACNFKLA